MIMPFSWIFHNIHADETADFLALVEPIAARFAAALAWARDPAAGLLVRAELVDEATAREFWLRLHEQCDEASLAMELIAAEAAWQPWPPAPNLSEGAIALLPAPALAARANSPTETLSPYRPPIPEETLYDLLRQDDPDLDGKLDEAIAAIEAAGLPVINLLSYLDLPLFQDYAAEHPEEREQNLFLHMLHTWACYRRFGAVHAAVSPALGEALADPRWLRVNTTQFQSPAPALCLQLPPWWQEMRGTACDASAAPLHWVKEIYLTHCEPPTPFDDRELTLMIVTHDERGQFGFVPLELPLSLPGLDQSLAAFFAPSLEDEQLGANTRDLCRIASLAAAYCLYATVRDPARYLPRASE